MVERRLFKNFDFGLVIVVVIITIYGLVMIYSASKGDLTRASIIHRQIMWAIAGALAFELAVSVDHKNYSRLTRWVYAVNIILLLGVLLIGHEHNSARSWFGFGSLGIQPSEFAKVAVIIVLAVFLARNQSTISELKTFMQSFGIVCVSLFLIMLQPDLGTAMALTAIWFGMAYAAGARAKHLTAFVLVVIVLGAAGWHGPSLMNKYLGWHAPSVFKEYQKKRLSSFIDPRVDPRKAGYQVIQSRIAVGSGQTTGKGYLHGTQSQLRFIPENHTDFIFTVVAEEMGFVGASILLLLYFILIFKGLVIVSETEDSVGRFAAVGVVCMFLFHIIVNIGMTLGIMPITGVPLPLFSYGGSSLLASMMSIGILVGVGMRRHKINF